MTRLSDQKVIHQRIHSADDLTQAMRGKNLYSGLTSHESSDSPHRTEYDRGAEGGNAFLLCLKQSLHQMLHAYKLSEHGNFKVLHTHPWTPEYPSWKKNHQNAVCMAKILPNDSKMGRS